MAEVVIGVDARRAALDDPGEDGPLSRIERDGAASHFALIPAHLVHASILATHGRDTPELRYGDSMTNPPEAWIAATGPRLVSDNPEDFAIPGEVLGDQSLSLMAKGLFALVLTAQGQPINPYDDPVEDVEAIGAAIDELVTAGLVVRVEP